MNEDFFNTQDSRGNIAFQKGQLTGQTRLLPMLQVTSCVSLTGDNGGLYCAPLVPLACDYLATVEGAIDTCRFSFPFVELEKQ